MPLHSALYCTALYLIQLNLLQTQWASQINTKTNKQKDNQQDRLYLLCLWYMHTAQRDGCLYCIRLVILFFFVLKVLRHGLCRQEDRTKKY